MRIALITWGSTGDFQPFLALAKELQRRGHEPVICSGSMHAERAAALGVPFRAVGIPIGETEMRTMLGVLDELRGMHSPAKQVERLSESLAPHWAQWYADCLDVLQDCDLAVCHSFDVVGETAAIKVGLPWVSVTPFPAMLTRDFSAFAADFGPWLNTLSWRLLARVSARQVARTRELLRELSGIERDVDVLGGVSPRLHMIAASPALAPVPSDAPAFVHSTGQWALPEPDYAPPPALAEFMAQDEPPVVISFGSMGTLAPAPLLERLLEAVRLARCRAVIQRGYSDFQAESLPAGVMLADFVPHDWLFTRAAAVVHHCGAGTSHAACRAGVPSVPVPQLFDQKYWAHWLRQAGVAPKPLPHARLSARRLAARIRLALDTPAYAARARALGARLRAERGAACAADLIEAAAAGAGSVAGKLAQA